MTMNENRWCSVQDSETSNGSDMSKHNKLLGKTDDFELVTWLVIK